jgi:hypothetical protein
VFKYGYVTSQPSGHRLEGRHVKSRLFFQILEHLRTGLIYIMHLYDNEFLPIFSRHLDLVSTTELEHRGVPASRSWIRQSQVQNEHDEQDEELSSQRQASRKAKNNIVFEYEG